MLGHCGNSGRVAGWCRRRSQSGYSLVELVITTAMILIVSAFAAPSLINYYRSARVRAAASSVSAYLNEGRQMAIKRNTPVCVGYTTTTIQYRLSTCGGTVLTVAGLTTSSSNVRLPDNINLSSTASAIFGNLGNATTGATYTVTDTVSTRTLTVTVAPSGRITVP
ncbi:MAG TPA: GspH/FimT family pseudopilin [Gemmatimonadales bacterium]|nr:GspH/FimT family pseudopilin [Gemmatimonadales bacterium]HUM18488.1 GspH/FimT family pseudopilin [Candidatus Nitrosotalea sp.]